MCYFKLVIVIISVILVAGCSNDTPLGSLKSDDLSQKYDQAFWARQQEQNTAIWQQALNLCNLQGFAGKPNCGTIMSIQWIANGDTKPVKYGSGTGFGANSIPSFTPATSK